MLPFQDHRIILNYRRRCRTAQERRRQLSAQKRLLFRLWLAPPDSTLLPDSWGDFYRSVTPGSVRGGIRGHEHGANCKAFEARQAASLGMTVGG